MGTNSRVGKRYGEYLISKQDGRVIIEYDSTLTDAQYAKLNPTKKKIGLKITR